MICKSVTTSDGTINSNDIREAVHEALQDGRLKDGAVKAGNDAVRSWLRTKGTRNCADWDIDSDSRLSSYNSDTSTTSSSSEDRYSDDDEEMENISSSDPEIFSDGETLSDTSSADSVFSSALSDYDPDYTNSSSSQSDSEPYEFDSEYESSSSG